MRWPIAFAAAVYALAVFVVFLTDGRPEGAGAFAVVVIGGVTVLSFAPLFSTFIGTRTWTLVATVLVVLLMVYFVVGLLLWFPVGAGLIAASIAGPPALRLRGSVARDHDRLDALQ